MPTVHLDESDCFSAWILARDADLKINTGESTEAKGIFLLSSYFEYEILFFILVNLGTLTLKALFEHWPKTWQGKFLRVTI